MTLTAKPLLKAAGLAIALLCAPQGAVAGQPAYRMVTDMAGRQVRLKPDIERIVLIRGRDIYELSALLGDELPAKLVAWGSEIKTADKDAYDKYCQHFPQLKTTPLIDDGNGESDVCGETLVTLKPDIVIADCFMIKRGYPSVAKFEKLGLPLFFVDESSDPLESPQKSLLALGNALGKSNRALQIVSFVNKRNQVVTERLAKIKGASPSVYLEAGSSGVHAYGAAYSGNYAFGAILAHSRVENITAGVIPSMGAASAEFVLRKNPDVIVITGANWLMPDTMRLGYAATFADSRQRLSGFTLRPGWSGLKAVREKQVYSVFHGFAMHIFDFAAYEYLAKACYPDQFKDIQPDADLKLFHDNFLPVKYSGVWMMRLQ